MRWLATTPIDKSGKAEAGGKMVVHQMEFPGVGWLSLFEDPDGRVLGMWKRAGCPEPPTEGRSSR